MNIEKVNKVLARTRYTIDELGTVHITGKDEELYPISNFFYQIKETIVVDDGQDSTKYAVCIGRLNGVIELGEVQVAFEKLSSTNWQLNMWGLKCIVFPGQNNLSHLFHIAQLLSMEAVEKTIYAHIGWHKIAGIWNYLHYDGAIGGANAEVQIDANLNRFRFPQIVENPRSSLKAVLTLHKIANVETIIPLIAFAFLAPLIELFKQNGRIPNFVLHLHGMTGTRKTSLALVLQSFFGDFGLSAPPASFKDTSNALELKGFQTKDALFLVDDYHPTVSSSEGKAMAQTFQRVLRSNGDRIGRGRMSSNLQLRKSYPPRGMTLITGEDLPSGHSSTLRLLAIELTKTEVDLSVLSHFQENRLVLNGAMLVFLEWLQPKFEEVAELIDGRFIQVRREYLTTTDHGRSAEAGSYLQIAYELMLNCLLDHDVIDQDREMKMRLRADRAIRALLTKNSELSKVQDPVSQFVETLTELLNRGKVVLSKKHETLGLRNLSGTAIGWVDEKHMYLLPDVTYTILMQHMSLRNQTVALTERTLWRQLANAGMIAVEKDGKRIRVDPKVELKAKDGTSQRVRVIKVKRYIFEHFLDEKEA